MRLQIFSLALIVTTVLADGASIVSAISTISATAAKLNTTVVHFQAGLLGLADVIPLLIDSTTLLHNIENGTKVADASAPLDVLETITVAGVTQTLVKDVQTLLTSIVNVKPTFDKLLIVSPIVLLNLKQQQKASDAFSKAVIAKVPDVFKAAAQSIVAPIDVAFVAAIDEYNPL